MACTMSSLMYKKRMCKYHPCRCHMYLMSSYHGRGSMNVRKAWSKIKAHLFLEEFVVMQQIVGVVIVVGDLVVHNQHPPPTCADPYNVQYCWCDNHIVYGKLYGNTHSVTYPLMHKNVVHSHHHILKWCEILYLRRLFLHWSLHTPKLMEDLMFSKCSLTKYQVDGYF